MENKVNVCGVANKGVLNALKHRLKVRTCRCHITVEAVDPLEVTRNDHSVKRTQKEFARCSPHVSL